MKQGNYFRLEKGLLSSRIGMRCPKFKMGYSVDPSNAGISNRFLLNNSSVWFIRSLRKGSGHEGR